MVLLLPGFTVFILMARPQGGADPLRPKMLAMGLGIASLGALQYSWNFRGLWLADPPPSGLFDALGKFWFDVTKADWRQTLVMSVSEAGLHNRPALYWFDLHQQFGTPGVLLAIAGFVFRGDTPAPHRRAPVPAVPGEPGLRLDVQRGRRARVLSAVSLHRGAVRRRRRGCLEKGSGCLFPALAEKGTRPFCSAPPAAACLLYAAWRGYDTFPAVDRSWDHRPEQVLSQFTTGSERRDGIGQGDLRRRCQLAGAERLRVLHEAREAGRAVVHLGRSRMAQSARGQRAVSSFHRGEHTRRPGSHRHA